SKRELRYTSSQDNEESFLVPKAPASETPKKQRVLRPVASNSKLLRKLSDESLASPERKARRSDKSDILGFSYSKSLARTLAKRGSHVKRIGEKLDLEVEETVLGENDEPDQSIWCGDEETPATRKEQKIQILEDEEEDDEDPVVDVRSRRRQLQMQSVEVKIVADLLPDMEQLREEKAKLEMPPPALNSMKLPFRKGHSTISNCAQDAVDLTSSPDPPASFVIQDRARSASLTHSSRPTSSSSFDAEAIMKFSPTPTKKRSPRKAPPISRPSTPPLPPSSPTKLISPSKKHRIPEAPALRPSIDAFWQADVVNDWNDQHSPRKPLFSPRKQKLWQALERQEKGTFSSDSDSETSIPSPTTSPRKKTQSRSQSPIKIPLSSTSPTVAQIRAQRKAFAASKHVLAESFLTDLDQKITNGEITRLSASTGGIKLLWSKTLKTTAGRANWRRETLRIKTGPAPTDVKPEVRHHCSIELAEKVIDDEERLYNVLAHEYCHLTTFMISNIRTNPHGKEFRSWASKVSEAFKDKSVEVTTKHSYAIEYKYVWECVNCSYEFKRHSKSVDPTRHSCGKCQGKLVQTKPVPRGGKTPGKARERSEYQVFVKENFSSVKARLEAQGKDAQMGRVMEAVAKEYRERK
ncbi:SprT-like family-domain-containing protein, partial [Lophiotrema nucula]